MSAELKSPEIVNFAILDVPRSRALERLTFHLDRWKVGYTTEETRNDWTVFYAEDGTLFDATRLQIFLFDIAKGRTVYVCNLADGWHSLFWNITREGLDAVYFRTTIPDTVRYGVHDMEVWQKGAVVRHIRTLQEIKRWEFWNQGTPLAFERAEDFKKRRVRDRFNLAHIEQYSEQFGFKFVEAYSHTGVGTLVSRIVSKPGHLEIV